MNALVKQPPRPVGRPSKYTGDMPRLAGALARSGLTMEEIGEELGLSVQTLCKWLHSKPEFAEAVNEGRAKFDSRVENSLARRALGYTRKEHKFFKIDDRIEAVEYEAYYPPDTAAAFIWLKNRQPHRWRDKVEIDGVVNHEHEHTIKAEPSTELAMAIIHTLLEGRRDHAARIIDHESETRQPDGAAQDLVHSEPLREAGGASLPRPDAREGVAPRAAPRRYRRRTDDMGSSGD